jgi:ATP phosphoribosyltransferase regulatory subunit
MTAITENLSLEEKIPLKLRALYERYGYQKYGMVKFESYDLYRENKNFLKSGAVITFTDPNGRLMALKPDVTMSIVKSVQPDAVSMKLYYLENVFRVSPGSRECSEVSQIGLEYIGAGSGYPEAEIVLLAIKSLQTISGDYLLSVSHMGYVSAVMDSCGLNEQGSALILEALRQKNNQKLKSIADDCRLPQGKTDLLLAMAGASGTLGEAIKSLGAFEQNGEMEAALGELELLCSALSSCGEDKRVRLDFAIINDMDYYNGMVFQGYIQGVPRAVLSGGRYDNLMRRFGKPQAAFGFALYLGELTRVFHVAKEYDADALLIYGNARPELIIKAMDRLFAEYKTVRAEPGPVGSIRARRVFRLSEDGRTEEQDL